MVTWDEPKRLSNLKDHGLDFIGCERVLDGPVIAQEDDRLAYGEQRINLIGFVGRAGRAYDLYGAGRRSTCHLSAQGNKA